MRLSGFPSRSALMLAVIFAMPATALAQGRELTLDLRPWSFDAGVAFPLSAGHLLGFSVGGGPDDFNKTFSPEVVDTISEFVTLEQIVRAGTFYRYESGRRFSVDLGLRAAFGGVRGTSGAINGVGGFHAAAFFGGRRLRVGPRLFVGSSTEHDVGTIVHVEWLTARWRVPF